MRERHGDDRIRAHVSGHHFYDLFGEGRGKGRKARNGSRANLLDRRGDRDGRQSSLLGMLGACGCGCDVVPSILPVLGFRRMTRSGRRLALSFFTDFERRGSLPELWHGRPHDRNALPEVSWRPQCKRTHTSFISTPKSESSSSEVRLALLVFLLVTCF